MVQNILVQRQMVHGIILVPLQIVHNILVQRQMVHAENVIV